MSLNQDGWWRDYVGGSLPSVARRRKRTHGGRRAGAGAKPIGRSIKAALREEHWALIERVAEELGVSEQEALRVLLDRLVGEERGR